MPGRSKKSLNIVLERDRQRYEIHPEAWAETLLTLEDWGWEPQQAMRVNYLSQELEVSEADALGLLMAGDNLLGMDLGQGVTIDPACGPTPRLTRHGRLLHVNAGMIHELVQFLKGGPFRICR